MLIGTHNIYESFNQGDSLYDLGDTGASIGNSINGTPMVYGGRLNGIANADMFYVASNNTILHRVEAGGPITALSSYAGDTIISMVVDPTNYRHLFVVDQQNRIWATLDEGQTFTELTANLHDLTQDHLGRTIEFYAAPDSPNGDVLLVGAEGGVFAMKHFDHAGAQWKLLGKDLPHCSVLDLHYDYTNNLLLAGTLGRGAWTLANPFGDDGSSADVPRAALIAWNVPGASPMAAGWDPRLVDASLAAITWGDQANAVTVAQFLFSTPRKGLKNTQPGGSTDALTVIYGNSTDDRYGG
jgi:hypothetical protein